MEDECYYVELQMFISTRTYLLATYIYSGGLKSTDNVSEANYNFLVL